MIVIYQKLPQGRHLRQRGLSVPMPPIAHSAHILLVADRIGRCLRFLSGNDGADPLAGLAAAGALPDLFPIDADGRMQQ